MSLLTTALLASGAAVGAYFGAPFALVPFAGSDTFVTYIHPGDGKMILKGREFHDFYISLSGFHLNRPNTDYFNSKKPPWEVLANERGTTDDDYDERPAWMKRFGYFPVGIPFQRSVNEEKFMWKEERNEETVSRDEMTRVFKVNTFQYVIEQTEVISKDGIQMRLKYIVGLRIVNPHKALIRTEDWLVQSEAAIQQDVRNWASSFEFMELMSQTDAKGIEAKLRENFEKMVRARDRNVQKRFGVAVDSADLKSIMPYGEKAQAYLDSIAAPFAATKAAEVKVTEATAEATATESIGMAEAKVAKAKAEASVAGDIARYKQAEEHKEGASVVIAGDALKGATVYAMPSGVTKLIDKLGDKL